MNTQASIPVAALYDRSLRRGRQRHLPPSTPRPQPTRAWPPENIALLERYYGWLLASGHSAYVVEHLYVPVAGHVLGLALKPHSQLDLATDLARAVDYICAKRLSVEWNSMNRNAIAKFGRYLQQLRGQPRPAFKSPDLSRYQAGLPGWFVEQLTRYQHLRQAGWRPARLNSSLLRFWSGHVRVWRWLFERYPIQNLSDVKRQQLLDYVDHRLAAGYSPKGINGDLRTFHGFLLFLQDQDWRVPQALLHTPCLKEPESLPRFLTDEQVIKLRADLESRVAAPPVRVPPRDTQLDRAAFYLLWQGGLRLSELEELRLADLDLPARKLMVRQGKGRRDRAVFLADSAISALQSYLAVRGQGPDDHAFLYRAEPVQKDLVRCRIKLAGKRAGVKVTPHALRHTFATQLLNAGCPITSIQKLLGHRRINSTLIYARIHDHQVADDYFTAMAQIEQRLALGDHEREREPDGVREQLLKLARELAKPRLAKQVRLDLVKDLRRVVKTEWSKLC